MPGPIRRRDNRSAALEKIEQSLAAKLRDKPARVRLFAPDFMVGQNIWAALPDLRKAIADRRKLPFDYSDEKPSSTQRKIRPLAVYFWGKVWTCVGWCELREDVRHFHLDRMRNWQVTAERYTDEPGRTLADFEHQIREQYAV